MPRQSARQRVIPHDQQFMVSASKRTGLYAVVHSGPGVRLERERHSAATRKDRQRYFLNFDGDPFADIRYSLNGTGAPGAALQSRKRTVLRARGSASGELLKRRKRIDQSKAVVDGVAPAGRPAKHAADRRGRRTGLDGRGDFGTVEQPGIDATEADQRIVEIKAEIDAAAALESLIQKMERGDRVQTTVVDVDDIRQRNVGISDDELIGIGAEGDSAGATVHDDARDAVAGVTAESEAKLRWIKRQEPLNPDVQCVGSADQRRRD